MRWLLVLLVLLLLNSAAAMQISEIMYDPVGKEPDGEWLELYNNDTSAVNLTGWKILESGYNRSLTLIDGTFALEPNNYIVVCRNATLFKADYPSYAKSLLQSTFSLNNSGESIQLLDASGAAVENVIYNSSLGANNNSKSLQLYNENWCEGNSTPGFANVCEDQEPPPKPQPVCGNGILEDGETSDTCCADAGCPQNKSCISNQCKFVADSENQNNTENETANETAPFLVSILELPAEAKQGENFTIRLELTNKFNETKTADIYSYAYSGSTLATEGGWTGNLQAINLTAGESTVVNLTNKIKVDAVVGIYSFKVRAVVDSKKYDKISAINIIVNSNPGNLSMPESSKFQASNITPSKSLNLTDDKSPAGAFVWSSGSTTIGIAFWLFTATLLVFVVVLLLMLLRKQNP